MQMNTWRTCMPMRMASDSIDYFKLSIHSKSWSDSVMSGGALEMELRILPSF